MSDEASSHDLHQIGAVADRVGLSQRTIRHYDEIHLVTPSGRSPGGFRLYTDRDVERLVHIKAMKPLGFSLEETGALLEIHDRIQADEALDADMLETLRTSVERAQQQCAKLATQLTEARALTNAIERELEIAERPSD